jgi:hypothetical protein
LYVCGHSFSRVIFDYPATGLYEAPQRMHDMATAKPTSPLPEEYHEALRATGATLKHIDPLTALGQWPLRKLRRKLRSCEERLSGEINSLYTEQHFLETLTPDTIKHLGECAIDTDVLNPGIYPGSPRTVGYQYIRFGHSSFVRCGSCKHFAARGEQVKCKILSAVYPEQGAPYDSPCLLRLMTPEQLHELRSDFQRAVEHAKKAREVVRTHLKALASLITTEVFPVMINDNYGLGTDRKFGYGDRVRVFVRAKACKESARFTWQPATVLSPKRPHVICLDHAIVLPGKRTDDVQAVLWPKHITILDSGEYELLHEWEYQWLRARYREEPDDPFLVEWRSCFDFDMGSSFDRIESRGPYWTFPAVRIVDELFTGKEVQPASQKQRLMSAKEAMQLLSVTAEMLADKKAPEQVVAKFYDALYAIPWQETLLRRAKATLLLRIEGSHWLGD